MWPCKHLLVRAINVEHRNIARGVGLLNRGKHLYHAPGRLPRRTVEKTRSEVSLLKSPFLYHRILCGIVHILNARKIQVLVDGVRRDSLWVDELVNNVMLALPRIAHGRSPGRGRSVREVHVVSPEHASNRERTIVSSHSHRFCCLFTGQATRDCAASMVVSHPDHESVVLVSHGGKDSVGALRASRCEGLVNDVNQTVGGVHISLDHRDVPLPSTACQANAVFVDRELLALEVRKRGPRGQLRFFQRSANNMRADDTPKLAGVLLCVEELALGRGPCSAVPAVIRGSKHSVLRAAGSGSAVAGELARESGSLHGLGELSKPRVGADRRHEVRVGGHRRAGAEYRREQCGFHPGGVGKL